VRLGGVNVRGVALGAKQCWLSAASGARLDELLLTTQI